MASKQKSGFTLLELIVAVAVTALLTGMLLSISTQILDTQTTSSGRLESNQVAQSVLDRIQEDLQCAVYRNDGNIWMAISILEDNENSGEWKKPNGNRNKPEEESLRIFKSQWPSDIPLEDSEYTDSLGQIPLRLSRFGVAGAWLRFFTQSPEIDQQGENTGAPRAVAYQIIRHGLTSSPTSTERYQLFRSDVSAKNSFLAGYNLDLEEGGYGSSASSSSLDLNDGNSPRTPSTVSNPIITDNPEYSKASFSVASNIIDFGIRAYVLETNSYGTGNLVQIFPPIDPKNPNTLISNDLFVTSRPKENDRTEPPFQFFPDVVDIMIRVLTVEGANTLSAFEREIIPKNESQNWWSIAEENSDVFIRRIKIYGRGL